MIKSVIFDIDGTLANLSHRLHHIREKQKDWASFFNEVDKDTLIEPIRSLLYTFEDDDYKILLVSGRPEKTRAATEKWMADNAIDFEELYMRPDNDCRPDDKVKSQILDGIIKDGYDVKFVIDDRPRVIAMWRERGLTCLQCREWMEDYIEYPFGILSLMVGPCGAGKSTWLASGIPINYNIKQEYIVSSDAIRQELCGNFKDQSKNDQVFDAIHSIVKARITNGLQTIVDATNIKRRDRLAIVNLAKGNPVKYFIVDRPLAEKRATGGWRNEIQGFDLIGKHHQTFHSQLPEIINGDNLSNVTAILLSGVKA